MTNFLYRETHSLKKYRPPLPYLSPEDRYVQRSTHEKNEINATSLEMCGFGEE